MARPLPHGAGPRGPVRAPLAVRRRQTPRRRCPTLPTVPAESGSSRLSNRRAWQGLVRAGHTPAREIAASSSSAPRPACRHPTCSETFLRITGNEAVASTPRDALSSASSRPRGNFAKTSESPIIPAQIEPRRPPPGYSGPRLCPAFVAKSLRGTGTSFRHPILGMPASSIAAARAWAGAWTTAKARRLVVSEDAARGVRFPPRFGSDRRAALGNEFFAARLERGPGVEGRPAFPRALAPGG